MKNTQKTPETISTSPNPVDQQQGSQFTSIEAIEAANQIHDAPNSRGQTNNAFPNCSATVCWAQDAIRLTKAFQLDEAGELLKISAPNLTQGAAKTVTLTLDEILQLGTESNQCISLGVIKDAPLDAAVPFTTASRLDAERKHDPRTIARTKDHLIFPNDRALYGFIDHDPDGTTFPPIEPKTLSELLRLMCEAWPECGLDQAAYIFTPSASAGVRREIDPPRDAELEYAGSGHISVAFAPGVDPTAWTQTLFAKLLEAGHGSAYITKLGQVDVRTLIDRSVAQPCRVEYTAPAVLGDGVVRDALKREQDQWQTSGGYIEVTAAALYTDEQVRRIVDTERERLGKLPEVQAGIDAARRAQELVQRLREGGNTLTLHADDPIDLILDDGTAVSVSAIYADMQAGGGQYHERGCSDPDSGQRGKAKIYYQALKQRVWIHSFAGGGREFAIVSAGPTKGVPRGRENLSSDSKVNDRIYELARLSTADFDRDRKLFCNELGMRMPVLENTIDKARKELKREKASALSQWTEQADTQVGTPIVLDPEGDLGYVVQALKSERDIGYRIAYDNFYADEVISPAGRNEWRSVENADMTELRLRLEVIGFEDVGREKMRDALHYVASRNRIDAAITWANSLPEWDGVSRIEAFYPTFLGTEDDAYARAVGLYTWTALAARLLVPGCKVDMIPTWIGAQGARKTSGVMAMVPSPEHYAEISFGESETELARKQRGKLVLEIAELSGYSKKEREAQKAWITRQHEEWTPKFFERMTRYPRRSICIATTNVDEFLQDPTGNRRWLPIMVGKVDVDRIIECREQLWAEGIAKFQECGVMWDAAEQEAAKILNNHEVENPYIDIIRNWLNTPQEASRS